MPPRKIEDKKYKSIGGPKRRSRLRRLAKGKSGGHSTSRVGPGYLKRGDYDEGDMYWPTSFTAEIRPGVNRTFSQDGRGMTEDKWASNIADLQNRPEGSVFHWQPTANDRPRVYRIDPGPNPNKPRLKSATKVPR